MKYIVIGLGNFGASLSTRLTEMGHEVLGVDNVMGRVESLKDKITHVVCMDCTDMNAVSTLPLQDTDAVIVSIGSDERASLLCTAIMKHFKVKKIMGRAVNSLHKTVMEAMQVDEIFQPEEEAAERFAKKLNIKGVIDSFAISDDYNIIEAEVPQKYVGKTLEEVRFRKIYNVVVLTTLKVTEKKNVMGAVKKVVTAQGVASPQTLLEEGNILVLYGSVKDIQKLLKVDE